MKLRILLSALAFLAGPAVALGLLWCAGPIQRGYPLSCVLFYGLVIGVLASRGAWHQLDPKP